MNLANDHLRGVVKLDGQTAVCNDESANHKFMLTKKNNPAKFG